MIEEQENGKLFNQIFQRLEKFSNLDLGDNDISNIIGDGPNPLHEKSGKAEASMFL